MTTTADVIKAAASVGRDVAEGRLEPAALDEAVADECKALFGTVVGEGDSLWPLHTDVARQVLAVGGLSADELSEWLAVARSRTGEPLSAPTPANEPQAVTAAAIELTEPEYDNEPEPAPEFASAADNECGCGDPNPAMVELPDGRRIPSRLIAARGRGLPTDDRL